MLVSLVYLKRASAAAVAITSLLVLAACGGGSERELSPLDADATAAAIIAASLPPTAVPPDFDPATIALEPVEGQLESYTISIPEGWQAEESPRPDGFARRYILDRGEGPIAQILVRCAVGADAETLMWQDSTVTENFDALRASFDRAGARDVTVGGLEGTQADFDVGLPGGTIEQRAVYLNGDPCGWRLALWTFGRGSRNHYAPLFERVLASFEPQPFDSPEFREPLRPPEND